MTKAIRNLTLLAILVTGGCIPLDFFDRPPPLECETLGYPCSLADVDFNVLQRSEDLSAELMAMLEGGASIDEALAYIQGQEGVVTARSSLTSINFRLEGGRDTFVFLPEALGPILEEAQAEPGARTIRPDTSAPKHSAAPPNAHVVGDNPESKSALVLSPFQYQFKQWDDGWAAAQILMGTRGYFGNVTYLENAAEGAGNVGIEQFKGWEQYDVILVSGHGSTACQGTDCVSTVLTGDVYNSAEELSGITDPGVNAIHVVGQDKGKLALSPDFFRLHYGAGLVNTIIFFNSCQTYGAGSGDVGSLSNALLGEGSVYLGWSDVVHSDVAYRASVSLYNDLASGLTVQAAADRLGVNGTDRYIHKRTGAQIEAILLVDRPSDRDLRDREVVILQDPDNGFELYNGSNIAAVGTANDGEIDFVPFQVLLEGVEEGQADTMTVNVSVQGYGVGATASSGQRVSEHGYLITGTIPYIDVAESQTVELRAATELPEGGTSEHIVSINLTADSNPPTDDGDGGGVREVWTGEASSTLQIILGSPAVVQVTANVTFEQTEYSVGKPTKRLKVTGGTMYWSRSGVISTLLDGDCSYSEGPIEVPILLDDGEIMIDTTTSPPTYTMHGSTEGPSVEVAEVCGDYAFGTSADGVWIPPITEYGQFFVSPDGGTIQGDTSDGNHSRNWTFTRQ